MDALKTLGVLALLAWGSGVHALDARDAQTAPASQNSYVWRLAAGGDLLAAVPESDAPGATLVLAPLEPVLATDGGNVATGINSILSLPLSNASRVNFGTGQQWVVSAAQRSAPWCNNLAGMLVYGASPADCQAMSDDAREPVLSRNQAVVGYATDRFDVTLGYGVTSGVSSTPFSGAATAPLGVDYLGLGALRGRDATGQDFALSGTWRFDPLTAVRVTASVGETLMREPLAPVWTSFEHAALGVGVSRGPFSGNVVGRVVRGPATAIEPAWGGLDIGVAWRTPWRGELSFGARNLLSTGPEPGTNPAEAEFDRDTSRTPYVQYKQDL